MLPGEGKSRVGLIKEGLVKRGGGHSRQKMSCEQNTELNI